MRWDFMYTNERDLVSFEKTMALLAKDGWEPVTVVLEPETRVGNTRFFANSRWVGFLKREIE